MPTDAPPSAGRENAEAVRERTLLDERARILAKPITQHRDTSDDIDMVMFALKPETYAIECRYVRAIGRSAGIATIPGTPSFVAGVVRMRGEIHSVFDLRILLGGQRQPLTGDAKVIAIGEQRIEFCLLVDDVAEIVILSTRDIRPREVPEDQGGYSFIRGVTTGAVQVLDAAAMLRDENLYVSGTDRI
jgi:purine-binding chemotaxis protein CheW